MIEYVPCGDYFIPDLKLRKTPPMAIVRIRELSASVVWGHAG